jgi:hypothetical protein
MRDEAVGVAWSIAGLENLRGYHVANGPATIHSTCQP